MELITSQNYVENVLRTESCDIERIRERMLPETIELLADAMRRATRAAYAVDALKKHIFYGKPMPTSVEPEPGEPSDIERIKPRLSDTVIRLLHAAMGMTTEAAEFIEAMEAHVFEGRPLNVTNLKEEVGDLHWYAGVAVSVLNTTMDEVLTVNIAKLRARYPDKFTEDAAINRNLEVEEKILEKKPSEEGQQEQAYVLALGRRLTEKEEDNLRDELKFIFDKYDVNGNLLEINPIRTATPKLDTTELIKEAAEC